MITSSLIICLLTSLFPCLTSWTRIRKEYTEANLFLFIASVFYTALLLYGVGGRVTGCIDDVASIQQMYGVINNTPYEQLQINTILIATTISVSFMNIALGGIFMKTKSPIYWGFFFTIIVIGLLSCIATAMSDTNPFTNFFMICCGIMAYFAFVLELTYKEFCVLGNIYLQGTICLLSAMAPLMLSIRKWVKGNLSVFKLCLVTINAIAHSILYIFVCRHYWMPLESAFNLCYRELVQCAAATGSTYIIVNLVIFVILFVLDLLFNAVLYKIISRYN